MVHAEEYSSSARNDDPTRLVSAIAGEIRAVDAALPVSNIARLTDLLDEDVAARRVGTIVLIAFAAFAVLLAIVGIYGVISYLVVQHTSEIGCASRWVHRRATS